MTRADIVGLLERHRDAFKRRDADALAAGHDQDGSFTSPAHGVVQGRQAILEVYRYWFTAFPDLHLTWNDAIVDGNRAAVFWTFAGTAHGPFFGVAGAGTRVELQGAAQYVFSEQGIASVRHVFDFSSVLVRTGVLKVKPGT